MGAAHSELNAAHPHGADQENTRPSLGLASRRQKPRLPSRVRGSYSLKAVLPALVPDMTYEGMLVAGGQDAGLAWESLIRGGLDQTERDRIKRALLDYCGQDTLAMVKLVDKLHV
jgi:hypothetical protein